MMSELLGVILYRSRSYTVSKVDIGSVDMRIVGLYADSGQVNEYYMPGATVRSVIKEGVTS